MSVYEKLLMDHEQIAIKDTLQLPGRFKGFYSDGVILIDKHLNSNERTEVLSEEIAHHKLTYGDITDQSNVQNKRYELKARRLANEQIITLSGIIDAFEFGVQNLFEMSQFFEVTEQFVMNTLEHYRRKYGLSKFHNDYLIKFNPLQVYKYIDKTE